MQSPFISPEDNFFQNSFDLWMKTDNFLNPCWKFPKISASEDTLTKSSEIEGSLLIEKVERDNSPFKTSLVDPEGVDAERTIILIGVIGLAFFLLFIVNLFIWVFHMEKELSSVKILCIDSFQ